MPNVSDEFVARAQRLAQETKSNLSKEAAQAQALTPTAELVADSLIAQGFVPAAEKQAAVVSLMDHEQTLKALHQVAGQVAVKQAQVQAPAQPAQTIPASSMGGAAGQMPKMAVDHRGEPLRESDTILFQRINLMGRH